MNLDLLLTTLGYITTAPYFWFTMGLVASAAMFVGAIIFDGNLSTTARGVIGLLSYIFFLIQVQLNRVTFTLNSGKSPGIKHMAYAGTVTIAIISVFWLFGVFLGVLTIYLSRKKKLKV